MSAESLLEYSRDRDLGRYIPRTQPEQHDRVELINIGDEQDRKHDEEKNMAKDEIRSKHAQFRDLAEELTTRLRDCVPAHSVPLSSPPCDVRGVGLELTSEGESDDKLEEESLNGNNGDHARQCLYEAESFQEHHNFEESEEHDDSNSVGDGS